MNRFFRTFFLIVALSGLAIYRPAVYATVNEVTARVAYTGNGSTTVFAYTWRIVDQAHLEVLVDGGTKVLTTDYTVSGVGASGGGNVTFVTAPANATKITILRKQPLSQPSDYITGEGFPSDRVEKDFDKNLMVDQMQAEQLDRSLKVPKKSTLTGNQTEIDIQACGDKYLKANAAGTGLECKALTATGAIATPVIPAQGGTGTDTTAGYTKSGLPAAGTAGRIARVTDQSTADAIPGLYVDDTTQWVALNHEAVNVKLFGAKGDGATDDTTAFNNALTAANKVKPLFLPPGNYVISNITLRGTASGGGEEGSTWGIIGSGVGTTTITGKAASTGVMIQVGSSSDAAVGYRRFILQGVKIVGHSGYDDGVKVGTQNAGNDVIILGRIQAVEATGFTKTNAAGVFLSQVVSFNIDNLYSYSNSHGLKLGSTAGAGTLTTVNVQNSQFRLNVYGMAIYQAAEVSTFNNIYEANTQYGLLIKSFSSVGLVNNIDHSFYQNHFEANTVGSVWITDDNPPNTAVPGNIKFVGGVYNKGATAIFKIDAGTEITINAHLIGPAAQNVIDNTLFKILFLNIFTAGAADQVDEGDLNTRLKYLSGAAGLGLRGQLQITPKTQGSGLLVSSTDFGAALAGPRLTVGRNSSAGNTQPGTLGLTAKDGTSGFIWYSSTDGNLHWNPTTVPPGIADDGGIVISTPSGTVTSLTATANQTTVNGATGAVTVGTVQSIGTGSNPQFSSLGLGGAAGGTTTLKLYGATSGSVIIAPAAVVGGNYIITLPGGTTDFSSTGGTSQVVKQTSAGGALSVAQLAASDLSNGTSGSGAVCLVTSCSLTTPNIGAATATSVSISAAGPNIKLSNADSQILIAGSTDPGWSVSAIQLAARGSMYSDGTAKMVFGENVYYSDDTRYIATAAAASIEINDGAIAIQTAASGTAGNAITFTAQLLVNASGLQIGSPTGGAKGTGTANFAADIYKNNTPYINPDWLLEWWATGAVKTYAANLHEYEADTGLRVDRLLTLQETEDFARQNFYLPLIGRNPSGIFARSNMALATIEDIYRHLFDLNTRIKQLEADHAN